MKTKKGLIAEIQREVSFCIGRCGEYPCGCHCIAMVCFQALTITHSGVLSVRTKLFQI